MTRLTVDPGVELVIQNLLRGVIRIEGQQVTPISYGSKEAAFDFPEENRPTMRLIVRRADGPYGTLGITFTASADLRRHLFSDHRSGSSRAENLVRPLGVTAPQKRVDPWPAVEDERVMDNLTPEQGLYVRERIARAMRKVYSEAERYARTTAARMRAHDLYVDLYGMVPSEGEGTPPVEEVLSLFGLNPRLRTANAEGWARLLVQPERTAQALDVMLKVARDGGGRDAWIAALTESGFSQA